MNFYIQQSIHIHFIKVGGITNSSVLQIGSAGIIKPASYLYNTGGFTQPAPVALKQPVTTVSYLLTPSVPLQAPVRNTNNKDGSSV
ncbi:spore germination protein GerPB [Bacillota bacterium Lsc_1132]